MKKIAVLDETNFNSSLDKGLTILIELLKNAHEMGITEISNTTKFPISTVARTISVLERRSFLIQNPVTKKYGLGVAMHKFININNYKNVLLNLSKEILHELRNRTNETALIYVRQGLHREHIYSVESFQELRTSSPVDNIFVPLYAGSASRVLWAFDTEENIVNLLDKLELIKITDSTIYNKSDLLKEAALIRSRGYAVSYGERSKGVGGISAPVFNSLQEVIASVSVSLPLIRMDHDKTESIIPDVLWAAQEISLNFNRQDE